MAGRLLDAEPRTGQRRFVCDSRLPLSGLQGLQLMMSRGGGIGDLGFVDRIIKILHLVAPLLPHPQRYFRLFQLPDRPFHDNVGGALASSSSLYILWS